MIVFPFSDDIWAELASEQLLQKPLGPTPSRPERWEAVPTWQRFSFTSYDRRHVGSGLDGARISKETEIQDQCTTTEKKRGGGGKEAFLFRNMWRGREDKWDISLKLTLEEVGLSVPHLVLASRDNCGVEIKNVKKPTYFTSVKAGKARHKPGNEPKRGNTSAGRRLKLQRFFYLSPVDTLRLVSGIRVEPFRLKAFVVHASNRVLKPTITRIENS